MHSDHRLLRERLLGLLGVTLAACAASPASGVGSSPEAPLAELPSAKQSARPRPPGPPAHPTAPPAPPGSWRLRFPLRNDPPPWCAEQGAECRPTGPRCEPQVQVECGCSPGTACLDPTAPCAAPLEPEVTREQRAQHPNACCYALPQHCIPPWAGRALPDAQGRPVYPAVRRGALAPASSAPLDGALALLLGERWLANAAAEAASVPSFARTERALLRFGAPEVLLRHTRRAALEEARHARDCFELAASLLCRSVEPEAVPEGVAAPELDSLAALAAETFRDACVCETAAVVALERALEELRWEPARPVLESLVRDEREHLELAWRTLAWAVERGGDAAKRALAAELARAEEATRDSRAGAREGALPEGFGWLDPTREARLREELFRDVLEPCARALLGGRAGRA